MRVQVRSIKPAVSRTMEKRQHTYGRCYANGVSKKGVTLNSGPTTDLQVSAVTETCGKAITADIV